MPPTATPPFPSRPHSQPTITSTAVPSKNHHSMAEPLPLSLAQSPPDAEAGARLMASSMSSKPQHHHRTTAQAVDSLLSIDFRPPPSEESTSLPAKIADISSSSSPPPSSFADLCERIQRKLKHCSLDDLSTVEQIQRWMSQYMSNHAEWEAYAHFDQYRYTRNLVLADEDYAEAASPSSPSDGPKWNLLLLCWGPGQQSPIHDHAGSHCVLKVLSGELMETRYDWPNVNHPMRVVGEDVRSLNQAAYMHDKLGLHRISNPSSDKPAVSLHLYWPPIDICSTFNESTGEARQGGRCVFFSERGQRVSALNRRGYQPAGAGLCSDK
jgi:cysteine dioxygenase